MWWTIVAIFLSSIHSFPCQIISYHQIFCFFLLLSAAKCVFDLAHFPAFVLFVVIIVIDWTKFQSQLVEKWSNSFEFKRSFIAKNLKINRNIFLHRYEIELSIEHIAWDMSSILCLLLLKCVKKNNDVNCGSVFFCSFRSFTHSDKLLLFFIVLFVQNCSSNMN